MGSLRLSPTVVVDSALRRAVVAMAALACAASLLAPLPAQEQGGRPGAAFPFSPEQLFNQLFGAESEAERRALREVEISPQEERQFGDAAARRFLDELKRNGIDATSRGRDVDYLRRLAETLRPQMENAARYRRLTIYVADAPPAEARAFPGGTLVFFRGLLELAESEAAVVGVVGHELSHLDRGHQLLVLRRAKLAQQAWGGRGGASPQPAVAAEAMMRAFAKPFRPEDEAQADADGVRWTYRAGYDPREMAKLFLARQRRNAAGGADFLPAFLRSHPVSADRFRAVNELYEELQRTEPKEKLYLGRLNLERRIARSQQEFPER